MTEEPQKEQKEVSNQEHSQEAKGGYKFTRDDLILALVIVWAICMIVFRY